MMNRQNVVLILDPEFDGDLWALSRDSHVWLLGSTHNKALARGVWDREPRDEGDLMATGVSTFEGGPALAETFYRILDTVDEHHSDHSTTPWRAIHVVGLPIERVSPTGVAETLSEGPVFRLVSEDRGAGFRIERAAQQGYLDSSVKRTVSSGPSS